MKTELDIFVGAPVDTLREYLNAGPVKRLEVRRIGEGKKRKITLTVVPEYEAAQADYPPINDSHVCPGNPGCP